MENGKVEEKTKKSGGGLKTILFMTLAGCLVPFGVPTLLVCLGMVPTVVALFTDTDEGRPTLASIAYLNFAGVLPFLIELWQNNQSMEVAISIVRNPSSWVVMLGAAGVAYAIMYVVPPVVASVVLLNQESRLKTLREGSKQLEAIWGPEVGSDVSVSEVLHNRGVI